MRSNGSNSTDCPVIIGIGNEILGDDGVGPYIIEELSKILKNDCVRLVKLGLGGIDILEYLKKSRRAWIIDASSFGIAPGTTRRYSSGSFPSHYKSRISSHFIDFEEIIKVGSNLFPGEMPEQIELILIEGKRFSEFTEKLSTPVELVANKVINSFLQLFRS